MIFELGNKRLIGDGKYWVAPSANVIGDVTLKNDSSVWFNAGYQRRYRKYYCG